MKKDKEMLQKLDSFFPKKSKKEQQILAELPDSYELDTPYVVAEKMHWSGPACVQMLFGFHGRSAPSQEEISTDMDLSDWRYMNHETLEEDLIRFMAKRNFVPGIYYPALYLRPQFENAEEMGDFMYRNTETISAHDHKYFKALLVKDRSPVFMRIHFTTDDYNMPEEMAQRLDNVGHGVLIVGYNKDGFLVHDPWNNQIWDGKKGGKRILITYEELIGENMPVNSTLDMVATFIPLRAYFRVPYQIPFPNKIIEVPLIVKSGGMKGIQSTHYQLMNIQGVLRSDGDLNVKNEVSTAASKSLSPGEDTKIIWKVNTGSNIGSFQLSAKIQASLELPVRPWERNNRCNETVTISTEAKIRIDVKDPTWFPLYGKL